jgi:hypothetical protein
MLCERAGLDFDTILEQMKDDVVKLLSRPSQLRASANSLPHGLYPSSPCRFDFMVDRQLKPWLIEVNQSPNLASIATVTKHVSAFFT